MKALKFGDIVGNGIIFNNITVLEVIDVNPIKYDGHQEEYVVCEPIKAEYTLIRVKDDENKIRPILITEHCRNTFLLADAIREE